MNKLEQQQMYLDQFYKVTELEITFDQIRSLFKSLRTEINHLPNGRERSLVLTKLEEAELWLTKVQL